ncbi:MAG: 50S ribosomal protein L35 [Clostridiaceae bacterium]|nr:50S ribosomal protein L35 [Clostridiaceae bacterium]
MPKIKTHSGAKKRFSVTKSGKVKLSSMNRRHDIKGCKSSKRKRHLRKAGYADASNVATLRRLVPYK